MKDYIQEHGYGKVLSLAQDGDFLRRERRRRDGLYEASSTTQEATNDMYLCKCTESAINVSSVTTFRRQNYLLEALWHILLCSDCEQYVPCNATSSGLRHHANRPLLRKLSGMSAPTKVCLRPLTSYLESKRSRRSLRSRASRCNRHRIARSCPTQGCWHMNKHSWTLRDSCFTIFQAFFLA